MLQKIYVLIFIFVGFILKINAQDCLHDTLQAKAFFNEATNFMNAANHDSAIIYFKQSADIYKNACIGNSSEKEMKAKYIRSESYIGYNLIQSGKTDSAITYLEGVLKVGTALLGNKHVELLFLYDIMGIANNELGNYDGAIVIFEKALNLKTEIYGEQHLDVAKSFNAIGITFNLKGKYSEAIVYFKKSLKAKRGYFR